MQYVFSNLGPVALDIEYDFRNFIHRAKDVQNCGDFAAQVKD